MPEKLQSNETRGRGAAIVLLIVAASCTSSPTSSGRELDQAVGSWSQPDTTLDASELLPRVFVTGDEVLVIFEQNGGEDVVGERYDPATGVATRIAPSGLIWRADAAMVWTGQELLMVGGSNGPGIDQIGAAYNPATDSWRTLPDPPGAADGWDKPIGGPAVWTGNEMLLYRHNLAFDPTPGSWRHMAPAPGPSRTTEISVWTGSELIVWGGCDATVAQCDDFSQALLTDGAAYDPGSDSWRQLAASPLAPGVHPAAVWTGDEVLVYAGLTTPGTHPTAAAHDPAADMWRVLADPPLTPRRYATSAWTGERFLVWGGSTMSEEFSNGVAYDPQLDAWAELPVAPAGSERDRHAMVWVGKRLYITGGYQTIGPLILELDP